MYHLAYLVSMASTRMPALAVDPPSPIVLVLPETIYSQE